MAQTGYTPISLYYSTTASAVPLSGNLVDGELAINTADEKLYFKNSSGTVKLLASTLVDLASQVTGTLPVANGGTGITSFGTGVATALGQNVSGTGSIALTDSPAFTTAVNIAAEGALRLQDASGGEYIAFKAPATVTSNTTFTLPDGDGTTGQFLSTNGSGTLSWASSSGISTGKAIAMSIVFG
jgi:hypothetical protein